MKLTYITSAFSQVKSFIKVKYLFLEIKDSSNFNSHKGRWEFLKFKICDFSINYGKTLAKVRRQEHNINNEINKCSNDSVL